MASKSKRRGRVFRASCILAALIIAGSSFAWFTSKDEVTNRLSASSDYGVSIVESYEPPKNWVPGQTVNKDVYAVNTGNVAAFVKEDITGRLSYTYEKPVAYVKSTAAATAKEKGVELNDNQKKLIDGSTTMEAGSILAWTDTDEPTGVKSVARQQEDPAVASRWTPTKTGVYVFRRSVDTTDANNTKFTYAGYYYDADTDKYYEIRIGNDVDPEHQTNGDDEWSVSSGSLGAGVRVDKDGIVITKNTDDTTTDPLTGATYADPTIQLVTVEEVAPKDVQFVFDEANKRLIVIEDTKGVAAAADTNGTGTNTYDASATAARAEVDYLNAKDDSDEATRDYNQVLFDYEYANALATARNKLVEAATTRRTAYNDYYKAQQNNTKAMSDVKTAAKTLEDTYVTINNRVANKNTPPAISPTDLLVSGSDLYNTVIAATATTMPQVYQNYTDLTNKWDEMYGTNGLASKIATTLTGLQDTSKSAAEIAALVQDLIKYTTDLEQALSDYKDMYAELVSDSALATHLDTGDADTKKASIEAQKTNATSLKNAVTAAGGVKAKSDDYTAKTAAEATQQTADSDAETAWEKAVRDYNIAVTNAKNEYTTNIGGSVGNYPYDDHSNTLVPYNATTPNNPGQVGGWSASSTSDPTITYNKAANQYNTYEEVTEDDSDTAAAAAGFDTDYQTTKVNKGTVGTIAAANMPDNGANGTFKGAGTKTIKTLRDEMNTAVNATDTAKAAYDAATQQLVDESGIIIYVNLDQNYADNWTFDYDDFMSVANGQKTAEFYYNKILGAGETSTRLIDSVKLADEVKANAYKSFVFDLNVGLDSIQVSYDNNDQNKISTTAVNADPAFKLDATMTDAKDITSNVIWAAPTP